MKQVICKNITSIQKEVIPLGTLDEASEDKSDDMIKIPTWKPFIIEYVK